MMVVLIPFFVVLIFCEYYVSLKKKIKIYFAGELISNLLNGLGQQVIGIFWIGLLIKIHQAFFHWKHWIEWDTNSWKTGIALLLITDFLWYFAHLASHRINIFVASHVTHHHAEDFNHASALRQSWSSRIFIYPFFLPLAFLGFQAEWILGAQVVSGAIQFLTHNGIHRKRIPIVDFLFVTPRFHYVHHGIDQPYLDKNYGGIFIFWDRIFGTFQDLGAEQIIRIGSGGSMNGFDPFESNFIYFKMIWAGIKIKNTISEKIKVLFDSPESLEKCLKINLLEIKPDKVEMMKLSKPEMKMVLLLLAVCFFIIFLLLSKILQFFWLAKVFFAFVFFLAIHCISKLCFKRSLKYAIQ